MNNKNIFLVLLFFFALLGGKAQNITFSGGSGTATDPYLIANATDLQTLADWVNGKKGTPNTFEGKFFRQTNDITLPDKRFTSIGMRGEDENEKVYYNYFKGVYDGDYHRIHNLLSGDYDREIQSFSAVCVGFFGAVSGKTAAVKNLFIVSGHVAGHLFVGGIAGEIANGAVIENCGVGKNLQVRAQMGYAAGICGTAGRETKVLRCVNFSDVYAMAANSFNAGGIVGQVVNGYVEGCANYGDIFAPRFAGGIVGGYPINIPGSTYQYYTLKSCYNAGDVSALLDAAGGIIGGWPYQDKEFKKAISHSYNYGRVFASEGAYAPVLALCLSAENQSSENTFYDKDRYKFVPDPNNPSASYVHGEAKSHAEMYSDGVLLLLNEGREYPFVKDEKKINQGYPVLKWINDLYLQHNDLYKSLVKDYDASLYRSQKSAGNLFKPNKYGDFYFINRDKQEVNIHLKAEGWRRGDAVLLQSKAAKGNVLMKVFSFTSFFKKKLTDDFIWDDNTDLIPNADRWIITPEFEVKSDTPYFCWDAASEDPEYPEGYMVYVGGENDVTPDPYLQQTPIFKIENEVPIQKGTETVVDEEGKSRTRTFFQLKNRSVNLSGYVGKKVRIAFRDNTRYSFSLWLANMQVAKTAGVEKVAEEETPLEIFVSPSHQLFVKTDPQTELYLYAADGTLLCQSVAEMSYEAPFSQVCFLKAVRKENKVTTKKITL